jgi:hypothetical protein
MQVHQPDIGTIGRIVFPTQIGKLHPQLGFFPLSSLCKHYIFASQEKKTRNIKTRKSGEMLDKC